MLVCCDHVTGSSLKSSERIPVTLDKRQTVVNVIFIDGILPQLDKCLKFMICFGEGGGGGVILYRVQFFYPTEQI